MPARMMRARLMTWPRMHYANLLAVVGRLDDAAAQVADGIGQARREGNAMALDIWAVLAGCVHLAAGRLSAARAAVESLPPPQPTGATELDVMRMVILAEVAVHTDDRNLLQQMANDARDAYPTGSSLYVGHQRTCWRGRRGSATTSMTRCAGSAATSPYSGHHLRLRS